MPSFVLFKHVVAKLIGIEQLNSIFSNGLSVLIGNMKFVVGYYNISSMEFMEPIPDKP